MCPNPESKARGEGSYCSIILMLTYVMYTHTNIPGKVSREIITFITCYFHSNCDKIFKIPKVVFEKLFDGPIPLFIILENSKREQSILPHVLW